MEILKERCRRLEKRLMGGGNRDERDQERQSFAWFTLLLKAKSLDRDTLSSVRNLQPP